MTLPNWLSIKLIFCESKKMIFFIFKNIENTDYPENVLIFWEREKPYFFKII